MKYWKVIIACFVIGLIHSSCNILGTYSSRSYSSGKPSKDEYKGSIHEDPGKPAENIDLIKIKRNHKVEFIHGVLPITREGLWEKENDTLIINYPESLKVDVYLIDEKKLISISDSTVFFKN